jgi:short-subunit dehydrogenase
MKPYVLITGASSGIGLSLARVFASKGHNLLLVARRQNILHSLADELLKNNKIHVDIFTCDLTQPSNIEDLLLFIKERNIRVEILINNAGLGDFSLFAESDFNKIKAVIDLNISAVVALTHILLPQMIKNGQGKILNVSSMAAFTPNPYLAVYAAAKSFILNFSHAIAAEVKSKNIQVSVLCPGDIKTGFQKEAGLEGFEVQSKITVEELAEFTYQKFIIEGEIEIVPDDTQRTIESLQKVTNKALLSDNFFKLRHMLALKLGKKNN